MIEPHRHAGRAERVVAIARRAQRFGQSVGGERIIRIARDSDPRGGDRGRHVALTKPDPRQVGPERRAIRCAARCLRIRAPSLLDPPIPFERKPQAVPVRRPSGITRDRELARARRDNAVLHAGAPGIAIRGERNGSRGHAHDANRRRGGREQMGAMSQRDVARAASGERGGDTEREPGNPIDADGSDGDETLHPIGAPRREQRTGEDAMTLERARERQRPGDDEHDERGEPDRAIRDRGLEHPVVRGHLWPSRAEDARALGEAVGWIGDREPIGPVAEERPIRECIDRARVNERAIHDRRTGCHAARAHTKGGQHEHGREASQGDRDHQHSASELPRGEGPTHTHDRDGRSADTEKGSPRRDEARHHQGRKGEHARGCASD